MLKKLGKFELIEELGSGAMGVVYKARDLSIGRIVALKTINAPLVGNPALLERFQMEARSAGTLRHPNIVTIYELGMEGGTPYIAMEFLEGESLEKVIDRRPVLTLAQKVGFMVPVCVALDYAHRRGIVHRDIKPANVMLTNNGNICIVDFGIARLMDASVTQTNCVIGTLGYMSPQQLHGQRGDQQSDIWAVGVMFYELLCYVRPFDGENQPALILSIDDRNQKPLPVTEFAPDCPRDLEALIGKMLQKDVGQRFQSMEELLYELEPIWQRLQEANVSGMISAAEVLIKTEDFPRARDLLRKAVQTDSHNHQAKLLLEQVNAEIKRIQTRGQIKTVVARARKLLDEGRVQEARAEAEAALRLDSASTEASEMLEHVQRALDRNHLVQEGIQATKRKLAQGALVEAAEEIEKVLRLNSVSSEAHDLQKQVQEQLTRREERKRLAEVLQSARKCWAEQRLDDCIGLLTAALNKFPNELEIIKLLEAAKHDRAEQQRNQKIAEVRRLLAEQRVDEALAIVNALLSEQPGDQGIQRLHALVCQEQTDLVRQRRFKSELTNLQSLINAGRFEQAISHGETLLREFPQETELEEILNFAHGEVVRLEKNRRIEEALQRIRKMMETEHFRDAVAAAEEALGTFPHQLLIKELLEQARAKKAEKQNRELLQQRLAEIRGKMNQGQHTDAVDLAQQTLTTFGSDAQVTQLLRLAEMELVQTREKRGAEDRQIAVAQTLFQEGRFDDATQILQGGLETQLLSKDDPRVRNLFEKIEYNKAPASVSDASPPDEPRDDPPTRSRPAQDYVLQQGALLRILHRASLGGHNDTASVGTSNEISSSAVSNTGEADLTLEKMQRYLDVAEPETGEHTSLQGFRRLSDLPARQFYSPLVY